MNNFKSIIIYSLIFVFLLSLTASFEANDIIQKDNIELNIGNDVMYEIFYGTLSEDNILPNDEENENNPDNTPNDNTVTQQDNVVEYNLGDSGKEVLSYQKILYYLDYTRDNPDGNFDENTKKAIESYQSDKQLLITGNLNSDTIISLRDEDIIYKQGKKGDEILQYQLILYYLDYINIYPNGNYGNITKTAVQNYQNDQSLNITGELDSITCNSLLEQKIVYKKGKKGDKIKEYQKKLISMGYLSGNADGDYGNMTVTAVNKYQENNNLEQTGEIDVLTQESLERPISDQEWK